ncbi:DUF3800 domain-containing protein [Bdellovibrionota bacterium FG-2]
MSFLFFIDESGQDRKDSPYEVLAGVCVEDQRLWELIQAIQQKEVDIFGCRISAGHKELKARELLKKKTFRLASQLPPFDSERRRQLAKECLEQGGSPTRERLTALSQAKIDFGLCTLQMCATFGVRAFASIVSRDAPRPGPGNYLRKDYAYLFERFFYFLEDMPGNAQGLVIFDEKEKSESHVLLGQMYEYFRTSAKGRQRASRVIPEAFFVHSDLTTAIQLADLIAYVIAWGVRLQMMTLPARSELKEIAEAVLRLRYKTRREIGGNPDFTIWSFSVIDDLLPRDRTER